MARAVCKGPGTKRATRERHAFGEIRLETEQRSFYRFSILAMQINRCITGGYIRKFGRPANAWKVLTLLGRFGSLSVSEINQHTTLEMDKLTRILDTLEHDGLAVRRRNMADRRVTTASLTVKGKKVAAETERMIAAMEREFLTILSRDEREALYETMDKLQERADELFKGKEPWSRFMRS